MIEVQITAACDGVGWIDRHIGLDFFDKLMFVVEDLIVAKAKVDEAPTIPIDDKSPAGPFDGIVITAASFPGNGFPFRKFVARDLGVRSLPVVFEGVTAAGRYDLLREIHAQKPAAAIDLVCAVVAGFARSPMPEPMPIIVDEVVLVVAARSGSLPQLEVQRRRNGNLFAVTDGFPIVSIPG